MTGNKVYEYPLETTDTQRIEMPEGAQIISVCERLNGVVVYAIVRDAGRHHRDREFKILGTGHTIEFDLDQFNFLGTVHIPTTLEMLHVWERRA